MITEPRILESGQIETPAGQIRFLILADRDLFTRRSNRFRQISQGHPLESYLDFLTLLTGAQQEALNQFPVLSMPDSKEQVLCREHGLPLLATRSWTRNPAWRRALTIILLKMSESTLPPMACATIAGLMQTNESGLEEMADRILAGELTEVSPRNVPFVSAALQVYWVHMASALGEGAFGKLEQGGLCPVCGSYPLAGIINNAGAEQGLRYLCCSLCASNWHLVRIKCSSCESTHGINHYILGGSNGAVKAESCDYCNTYLKLFYLDKDCQVEAIADDLATLSLDMLMDNEGKNRGGPNLLFHTGSF